MTHLSRICSVIWGICPDISPRLFTIKNANTKRIKDRHLAEYFDSRAVWLTGFGRQTPNQATWVRSPRRASYCSGSRPNVFLLLFTRLNVHTIVVHDSFCCSVVSVEQEQQKNGRTFRCSSRCCRRRRGSLPHRRPHRRRRPSRRRRSRLALPIPALARRRRPRLKKLWQVGASRPRNPKKL